MPDISEVKKLNIDDTLYETEVPDSYGVKWEPKDIKLITAFIPGTVVEVKTIVGAKVKTGDILLILDAMKMHNELTAPIDGIVEVVAISNGERVEKNQLLIRLK